MGDEKDWIVDGSLIIMTDMFEGRKVCEMFEIHYWQLRQLKIRVWTLDGSSI